MTTVRTRALELSSDSDYCTTDGPVEQFDNPGDAKLEADAHLAIVSDEVVFRLAGSEPRAQRFLTEFPRVVDGAAGPKQKPIDAFQTVFRRIYSQDIGLINGVLYQTAIGRRTLQACGAYARLSNAHLYGEELSEDALVVTMNAYRSPAQLIQAGLKTFDRKMCEILYGLNYSDAVRDIDADSRGALVEPSGHDLRMLAALSLDQLRAYDPADPVVTDGRVSRVSIAPDIERARGLPVYADFRHPTTRPHRGCPVMPNLPANDILHGGSGIGNLWHQRASGLIVATDMHALTVPQEGLELAA